MRTTMRRWVAVVALLLAAGCGAAPAAPVTPSRTPDPPRPDPVVACTDQLVYWAGEQLRGATDIGYDYQHMGLTGDQADALRRIVDRARAEGAGVVSGLARSECAAIMAKPATGGPWGY